MSNDNLVFLHDPIQDDDATQWQSEEDRARLIMDGETGELGDDDTTIVDPTVEMTQVPTTETRPFWRRAFG